jgi:hypothetical protein
MSDPSTEASTARSKSSAAAAGVDWGANQAGEYALLVLPVVTQQNIATDSKQDSGTAVDERTGLNM